MNVKTSGKNVNIIKKMVSKSFVRFAENMFKHVYIFLTQDEQQHNG